MEQGREKRFKPGILLVSLILHLALMVAFAMIQFSRGRLLDFFVESPQARIRALERIEQAGIVVPKPMIKERSGGGFDGGLFSSGQGLGLLESALGAGGFGSGAGQGGGTGAGSGFVSGAGEGQAEGFLRSIAKAEGGGGEGEAFMTIADESADIDVNTVAFFGNVASSRKVCFVVDCSGSMLGFFRQVQENLIQSIGSLRQDNFFGIIVFHGQRVYEFRKDTLARASDANKARAIEFINSIPMPQGNPDAMDAMKSAIHYTDSIGDSPGVIYFLTDGFDYTDFPEKIGEYRRQIAPVVRIHTIGFMVNRRDAVMLEKMAIESGGGFTLYSGGVN